MDLTWDRVLAWRRRRHFLAKPASTTEAVIDRLTTVPAASGDVELAVGIRLDPSVSSAVAAAVVDGRLISTFTFRGAMHIGTHEQTARFLAMRRASRQWERPSWRAHYGLAPEDWPRLHDVVREALSSGPLTPEELARAVGSVPGFGHVESVFSTTLLKALAWNGDLCMETLHAGPSRLRGLVDDPLWPGLPDLDDAGRAALVDYLGAYGAADLDRLHYWFGAGLSLGRRRLETWVADLGERVAAVSVEGQPAWCLAEHVDEVLAAEPRNDVDLLPGSDQWVLGAGTSDPNIVPPHHRSLATRGKPLILHGGRVSGTWRIVPRAFSMHWFSDRGVPHAELERAAERIVTRKGVAADIDIVRT